MLEDIRVYMKRGHQPPLKFGKSAATAGLLMKHAPRRAACKLSLFGEKILQVSKFGLKREVDACAPTLCALMRERDSLRSLSLQLPLSFSR